MVCCMCICVFQGRMCARGMSVYFKQTLPIVMMPPFFRTGRRDYAYTWARVEPWIEWLSTATMVSPTASWERQAGESCTISCRVLMYTCICSGAHTYLCVCACVHECMRVSACACLCTCGCMFMYVLMHLCTCTYVCKCVYMCVVLRVYVWANTASSKATRLFLVKQ